MTNSKQIQTIFVWREKLQDPALYADPRPARCPYCGETPFYSHECFPKTFPSYGRLPHYESSTSTCPLCGWYIYVQAWPTDPTSKGSFARRAALRAFDLNSPDLPLRILGTHLKQHFSDIYDLEWRRFEELTADVFREHGYSIILTPPIKDRGADLIVLSHDRTGVQAIVECKKFSQNRKVGVALVRELVGACVEWGVQKAYIVTTSDLSSVASSAASAYATRGYEIELLPAHDFLAMLGVYNEKLPPLHMLLDRTREEIARQNRIILGIEEGDSNV